MKEQLEMEILEFLRNLQVRLINKPHFQDEWVFTNLGKIIAKIEENEK